jgi:hypothetical protein
MLRWICGYAFNDPLSDRGSSTRVGLNRIAGGLFPVLSLAESQVFASVNVMADALSADQVTMKTAIEKPPPEILPLDAATAKASGIAYASVPGTLATLKVNPLPKK